jgi:hypothetical protein
MSTLKVEQTEAKAQHVKVTADTLTVDLTDGRTRPKAACPARLKPRPLTTLDYIGQERALHLKDVTPYTNGFVELRYEIRNSGTTQDDPRISRLRSFLFRFPTPFFWRKTTTCQSSILEHHEIWGSSRN